jgi:hypothetical protein
VKRFLRSLLEGVVWKLFVIVLTPIATLVGGKLESGDWLAWIRLIPAWGYYCFAGAVVLWIGSGLFIKRLRYLQQKNLPTPPGIITIPRWGYTRVAEL